MLCSLQAVVAVGTWQSNVKNTNASESLSSLPSALCTVLHRLVKIILFHYFVPEIDQKS